MSDIAKNILEDIIIMKNEASHEMFDKPYALLEIAERQLVNEYIHDLDHPVWKPITVKGMSTIYEISNTGSIRNVITGTIRKPTEVWSGYLKINFYKNAKCVTVLIHRLVAESFVPNPNNLPVVNHKNGVKTFNWYKNLEWCTQQENTQHAIDKGLSLRSGTDNPNNKYDEDIIHTVCKLLEDGHTPTKISKMIDVSVTLPENIKRGKLWKEIASQYKIPEPVSVKRSDELKAYMEELIYAGYTNREIVQASGLPDTEHEREYVGLFRRRLLKKTI